MSETTTAENRDDGGPVNFMSLRDYFAGQYLAGRASRSETIINFDEVATDAFAAADALLKARVEQ